MLGPETLRLNLREVCLCVTSSEFLVQLWIFSWYKIKFMNFYLFFLMLVTLMLICDAATNHTPHCWGRWGQGEASAVREGRSQRDDSAAVHGTANQRHTHKVGDAQQSPESWRKERQTHTHSRVLCFVLFFVYKADVDFDSISQTEHSALDKTSIRHTHMYTQRDKCIKEKSEELTAICVSIFTFLTSPKAKTKLPTVQR